MKYLLSVIVLVLFGAGCVGTQRVSQTNESVRKNSIVTVPQVMIPKDAKTELWVIRNITDSSIRYSPIEWFSGEQAIAQAKKDGCKDGCAPGGFYWRYMKGVSAPIDVTLNNASSIAVKLICNREDCHPDHPDQDGFKTVSFSEYMAADQRCRTMPLDCPYYALGTTMDFFDVTLTKDYSILLLTERYVP